MKNKKINRCAWNRRVSEVRCQGDAIVTNCYSQGLWRIPETGNRDSIASNLLVLELKVHPDLLATEP